MINGQRFFVLYTPPMQLWRVTLYFKTSRNPIPPLIHQGTQYYMAQEKADILAEHFESIHGLTTTQMITRHAEAVEKLVKKVGQMMGKRIDVQRTITQTEVQKQIRKLK
jgi:hypothetical protein